MITLLVLWVGFGNLFVLYHIHEYGIPSEIGYSNWANWGLLFYWLFWPIMSAAMIITEVEYVNKQEHNDG